MAQEFEQPQVEQPQDAPGTLRAQRMTAAESRAVIDLWQQERTEQTGLTDRPAVPDVAEGLDITVEDVRRLLQDVRAKRIAEERALATEQELSEIRLAEEERKLAEVWRQRAELRREQASPQRPEQLPRHRQFLLQSEWIEVKPGVWEDARDPAHSYVDFNQLAPNKDGNQIVRPLAPRFALALAKFVFLSFLLGVFIVAPLFYVFWCIFTGPH